MNTAIMKKHRAFLSVMCSLLFVSLAGCEGYLDRYPLDAPSSASFPQSKVELEVAVNGAYNSLYRRLGGQMQDELFWDNVTDLGYVRGGYESSESIMTGVASTRAFETHWSHRYQGIQRANFIIERLPQARTFIDAEFCDRSEAEAKFIRAYHYMHLTERYGDVPLVINSQKLGDANIGRTSKAEIADFMLADLDYAIDKLPESYPEAERGKVTKGAALALKSRIALYNGRFETAAASAAAVMEMPYRLHPSYGELFQVGGNGSDEIIFQLSYHPDVYRNTDHIFYTMNGWGGWSITVPSQWLVDSYLCTDGLPIDQSPSYNQAEPFENRDPRLRQSLLVPGDWFAGVKYETHPDSTTTLQEVNGELTRISNPTVLNTYASFTGYQWRKYADETQFWDLNSGQGTLPLRLIRLGEVLLNYIEAKVELNEIDRSVYDAMNAIRGRAGMPLIKEGLGHDEWREAVRLERKVELAGEGFRMYDIRRWKIAEHVIPGNLPGRKKKEYWFTPGIPTINAYGHPVYQNQDDVFKIIQVRKFNNPRDYLWAIPQSDMDINDLLKQNPGY